MPWVVLVNAYSTGGRHLVEPRPFVEKPTSDEKPIWAQPLKNQLVLRGARLASPFMQATGTALLAESVRRQSVPIQHRYDRFSYNPRSMQPAGFKPDPRTKHARRGLMARPEYAQEEKFWKKRQRAQARYVKTPAVAGAGFIGLGKVLPVMAIGYIAYDVLTGDSSDPYSESPEDVMGRTYFGSAWEVIKYSPELAKSLHERNLETITLGGEIGAAAIDWAQGAAARAIGFALLQGVFG